MSWEPKDENVDPATKPRSLTAEEVEWLVDSLDAPLTRDPVSRAVGKIMIASYIIFQLNVWELCPGKDNLESLRDVIIKRHRIAQIKRGEPVGYHSSDAIGASISQAALDSFSTVGKTSTVGQGVKGFEALLYTKLIRSDMAMDIHFRTRMTFDDVIDLRSFFVSRSVLDFIETRVVNNNKILNTEIGVFVRHDRQPVPERLVFGESEGRILKSEWWYETYDAMHPEAETEYPSHIMRIHLNKNALYASKVTVDELAQAIAGENYSSYQQKQSMYFDAVASPMSAGPYIDLVPRDTVADLAGEMPQAARTFLYNVVAPNLGKVHVKGIEGISGLIPVVVDILSVFKESSQMKDFEIQKYGLDPADKKMLWKLPVHRGKMRLKAIRYAQLERFFKAAGVEIIGKTISRQQGDIYKVLSEAGYRLPPLPDEPVGYYLRLPEEVNNVMQYLRGRIEEVPSLQKESTYVYAVATGSNLREVTSLPWVDDTVTICNNMHQISEVYGVESARSYFIYELGAVLAGAGVGNLNPRNLTLLINFIFSRGFPLGIKHVSMVKRGEEFLSSAVNEEWSNIISHAAATGEEESTRSVTGAVLSGGRARLGQWTYEVDHSEDSINFIIEQLEKEELIYQYRRNPEAFINVMTKPPEDEAVGTYVPPVSEETAAAEINFDDIEIDQVERTIAKEETTTSGWPIFDANLKTPVYVQGAGKPGWFKAAMTKYGPKVKNLILALPTEKKVAFADDSGIQTRPQTPPAPSRPEPPAPKLPRRSFALTAIRGLDSTYWMKLFADLNFELVEISGNLKYVDFLDVADLNDKNTASWQISAILKSTLDEGRVITNKFNLYKNMLAANPEVTRKYFPSTIELSKIPVGTYPKNNPVMIIRPIGVEAYSGHDIHVVTNSQELEAARLAILPPGGKKYSTAIISSYIRDPQLTFEGKKFHLRMHMMVINGPDYTPTFQYYLAPRGRLYTAKLPYVDGDFDNHDIHDTHAASTTTNYYFPEDLPHPEMKDEYLRQMREIVDAMGEVARNQMKPYPEARNGYDVLGLDFIITQDHKVKILEANSKPGYTAYDLNGVRTRFGTWDQKYIAYSADYYRWVAEKAILPIFGNAVVETGPAKDDYEIPGITDVPMGDITTSSKTLVLPPENMDRLVEMLRDATLRP